jgi:predicted nucleic-acid-binding Zn-ribbon protein
MTGFSPCPNCGGTTLYRGPETSAGGGHAPNYLPGLGRFLRTARFTLVVCRDCGLTRFFAEPEARAKLKESGKWKSL